MFFFEEQESYVTMSIRYLNISHNTPCLLPTHPPPPPPNFA